MAIPIGPISRRTSKILTDTWKDLDAIEKHNRALPGYTFDGGFSLSDAEAARFNNNNHFWSELTAYDSSTGLFSWKRVFPEEFISGKDPSYSDDEAAVAGTATVHPAYEINGIATRVGTIVEMYRSHFDTTYDMMYCFHKPNSGPHEQSGPPDENDDIDDGYVPGDVIIDTDTDPDTIYIAKRTSPAGSAKWCEIVTMEKLQTILANSPCC